MGMVAIFGHVSYLYLLNTPYEILNSNSPVISWKNDVKICMWQSKVSGLGCKVIGQLDLWCLYKTSVSFSLTFLSSIIISA